MSEVRSVSVAYAEQVPGQAVPPHRVFWATPVALAALVWLARLVVFELGVNADMASYRNCAGVKLGSAGGSMTPFCAVIRV